MTVVLGNGVTVVIAPRYSFEGVVMRCNCPLTLLILASVVAATCPVRADCEGGPVFTQTVSAIDKDTLVWQTTTDVEFAKGPLHEVQDYTLWMRGRLAGASALNIAYDEPDPGRGVFYLIKSDVPVCGSWQSSDGSELLRDSRIPPGCNAVAPTEQQMTDAIQVGLAAAASPWTNDDDAAQFNQVVQGELGCAFETDGTAFASLDATDSPPQWNPDRFYCGPPWLVSPAGPCLNAACFEHDTCYFVNCVGGWCPFSTQTDVVGCDDPLVVDACDPITGCLAQDGTFWFSSNLFICLLANALTLSTANPLCDDPACDASGVQCNSSAGECCLLDGSIAPTSWWRAEYNAIDSAGTYDGVLRGNTSFVSGAIGQAFALPGEDNYIALGDALDEITVPFAVEESSPKLVESRHGS